MREFTRDYNLKPGDDISEKMGVSVNLRVIETLDEPPMGPDSGFYPKKTTSRGSKGLVLTSNGHVIFRKVLIEFGTVSPDILIHHDGNLGDKSGDLIRKYERSFNTALDMDFD